MRRFVRFHKISRLFLPVLQRLPKHRLKSQHHRSSRMLFSFRFRQKCMIQHRKWHLCYKQLLTSQHHPMHHQVRMYLFRNKHTLHRLNRYRLTRLLLMCKHRLLVRHFQIQKRAYLLRTSIMKSRCSRLSKMNLLCKKISPLPLCLLTTNYSTVLL